MFIEFKKKVSILKSKFSFHTLNLFLDFIYKFEYPIKKKVACLYFLQYTFAFIIYEENSYVTNWFTISHRYYS